MAVRVLWWVFLGVLIGVVVLLVIVLCYVFLKTRPKSRVLQTYDASSDWIEEEDACRKIPLEEIYITTNNLNPANIIGQGIAGKVYKGILSNGSHVAVKHILKDGHVETFAREVTSLSHIRHPNLVILRGYCEEEGECFLVYELCPKGNLSEWLFGNDKKLSWLQRLEIAIDSARGLWFLHTYAGGCIVHRDVKPANILLGQDFQAKLADFGLSKLMDLEVSCVSSEVRGTFGYVDPEYRQNRHVHTTGDVYSFGIVLLQIVSGKRVLNLTATRPMPLDRMAEILTRSGDISEFADPSLSGEYSLEALKLVVKLALSCTGHKQKRPSMEQVVSKLEKALDISSKGNKMYHTRIRVTPDPAVVQIDVAKC